jgi:hypothetical protein
MIMAKVLLFSFVVLIAGGLAFLAFSTVPAPTHPVEKPISVERFLKQ